MAVVASGAAKLLIVWVICVACICYGVFGQSDLEASCFDFTWLGPEYTEDSIVNGTCDEMEPRPSVCVDPLVYTIDGSPPNLTYMWLDSDTRIKTTCRLAKGEVCARWTFTFNKELENVTYLCTKVTENDQARTHGCWDSQRDGRQIQVCACQTPLSSANNSVFPCNSAWDIRGAPAPLLAAVAVVLVALSR